MNVNKSDIKEILIQLGTTSISESLLEKCQILCDKHNLSLLEFEQSLDAYLVSNNDQTFSIDSIGVFEQQIFKENQKERIKPHHSSSSSNSLLNSPSDFGVLSGKRPNQFSSPIFTNKSIAIKLNEDSSPGSIISAQSPITDNLGSSLVNTYKTRENVGSSMVSSSLSLGPRGMFTPSSSKPYGNDCTLFKFKLLFTIYYLFTINFFISITINF